MDDKVIDKVKESERSHAPDAPNALFFEHWSLEIGHFPPLTPLPCHSNVRTLENGEPTCPSGTKAESAARERGRPMEPAPGNAGEGTLRGGPPASWTNCASK